MKNFILFLGLKLISCASDTESICTIESNHIRIFNNQKICNFIENPRIFYKDNQLNETEIKKIIYKIFKNQNLFFKIKNEDYLFNILNIRKNWHSENICKIFCLLDKYHDDPEIAIIWMQEFINEKNIKIFQTHFEKLLSKIGYWTASFDLLLFLAKERNIEISSKGLISTMKNALRCDFSEPFEGLYSLTTVIQYCEEKKIHLPYSNYHIFKDMILSKSQKYNDTIERLGNIMNIE